MKILARNKIKCHDFGQHSRSFLLVLFCLHSANSKDSMVWPLLGLCPSWAKQRVKHLTLQSKIEINSAIEVSEWYPKRFAFEVCPNMAGRSPLKGREPKLHETIISKADSCFVQKNNWASWKRNGSRNCIAWIKSLTKDWDKSEAGSNQVAVFPLIETNQWSKHRKTSYLMLVCQILKCPSLRHVNII